MAIAKKRLWVVPCGLCEGAGSVALGHSNDPNVRTAKCDECGGTGVVQDEMATIAEVIEGARIKNDAPSRLLVSALSLLEVRS